MKHRQIENTFMNIIELSLLEVQKVRTTKSLRNVLFGLLYFWNSFSTNIELHHPVNNNPKDCFIYIRLNITRVYT